METITKTEKARIKCTFQGLKLKHFTEDCKPDIAVSQDDSDGFNLKLILFLYYGEKKSPDFKSFLSEAALPLHGVLKGRLFDLASFFEGGTREFGEPYIEAIEQVLNMSGSLHFSYSKDYGDDGQPVARFEFGNSYIYFSFSEADSKSYFEKV